MNFWSNNGILTRDFYSSSKNPSPFWRTSCLPSDSCDEKMMKEWTANEWANYFTNPPTPGSSGKILVADVHRAQQTADVKKLLQNKSTLLINAPPGCTSRVQPLYQQAI